MATGQKMPFQSREGWLCAVICGFLAEVFGGGLQRCGLNTCRMYCVQKDKDGAKYRHVLNMLCHPEEENTDSAEDSIILSMLSLSWADAF